MLRLFRAVLLFATLWTVAHQTSLSMGFSRQGYWNRLPCTPTEDLLTQGSNSRLLCLLLWQVWSLPHTTPEKPQQWYKNKKKWISRRNEVIQINYKWSNLHVYIYTEICNKCKGVICQNLILTLFSDIIAVAISLTLSYLQYYHK